MKLGPLPEKFKDQVSFFIDLEGKVQDILDLGAKGEHLGRLAYGQEVFNAIYKLVPISQHFKLQAVPGDNNSRMKLENTKKKVMKFRDTANLLEKHGREKDDGDDLYNLYDHEPNYQASNSYPPPSILPSSTTSTASTVFTVSNP